MKNKYLFNILVMFLALFFLTGCGEGHWQGSTIASFVVKASGFIYNAILMIIIVILFIVPVFMVSIVALIISIPLDIFVGIWTFDFSFPVLNMVLETIGKIRNKGSF